MSPATEQAGDRPATPDRPAGAPAQAAPRAAGPGNGFATAALVLGAAGMTLVTIVPGILLGVLGLRRATALRAGRLRAWLGICLCVLWAAAGSYLLPHLLLAADPGCTAYKGPALTAYNNAISDFSGDQTTRSVAADVSSAIGALRTATARSRDPATTRALSVLTADLRAILGQIHAGGLITDRSMRALNRDAARADAACGTLHV